MISDATTLTSLPAGRRRRPRAQTALLWGAISLAVAAAAVAVTNTDRAAWLAVVTVAGVLGFIGYLDGLTQRIRNRHTGILAAVAIVGTFVDQILEPSSITLVAAIAIATIMFGLLLGVAMLTGGLGGGDIKVAPFIALTLALVSPLTPMLWLLIAVLLAGGHVFINHRPGRHVPLGSWMAISLPISIVATAGISALAGFPLTFGQF